MIREHPVRGRASQATPSSPAKGVGGKREKGELVGERQVLGDKPYSNKLCPLLTFPCGHQVTT